MSVTHIAGNVVSIGHRKIQRCAVCGDKMADNIAILQGRVASIGATKCELLTWPIGGLVNQDGNRMVVVDHDDGTDVPDDCCISLVESD